MRFTCSRVIFGVALACGVAACSFAPPPAHPRPTLPPSTELAAKPIAAPRLVHWRRTDGARWRGILEGPDERVGFELWGERSARTPRPLVLLVPILAGGAGLMEYVAAGMYERGFDVAYCDRAGSALAIGQRGADLQELFRRTVLHQRLLLRWLRDGAAARPQFVLGISLGGMVATSVAAHEPELRGVALCLAGGDLASLVPRSGEARVRRWVDWRQREDGVGLDHLSWELRRQMRFDPCAMAGAVATDKVLVVAASFDDVVPQANQDLLWEALGRPSRLNVPLGHYTAALAIGPILSATAAHFRGRLSDPPRPPAVGEATP